MLTIKEIIRTLYNALVQKLKNHRGNWEQNDPTADDYIKNRPFYTEGKKEVFLFKDYTGTGTRPSCTFVVGQSYNVTWNGVLYLNIICKNSDGYRSLGGSSEYPFYIDDDGGNSLYIEGEDYSVSISTYEESIRKLDKKYLPDLGLAPVATSGNYYDLYGKPIVYEDVVRYNNSQGLTAAQKQTARNNIGAITNSDVVGVVKYNETQTLTNTQKTQARTNIGAVGYETQTLNNTQKQTARNNIGASDFSGSYNDLTDKPTNLATKAEIPDVSKFVEETHLTDYSISGNFNDIRCGSLGSNKYFSWLGDNRIRFYPNGNVSSTNQLQGYVEVIGENNNGLINLSFFSNHMDEDGVLSSGRPRLVNIETPLYNYDAANKKYVDTAVANLVDSAPETLNTLGELATALQENQTVVDAVNSAITNKVDKVEGKGLSTNDYTGEDKEKLANTVVFVEQSLTDEQKAQARENIGAGTSSFSGSYNDLSDKPDEIVIDEELSGTSTNPVQNKAVYEAINTPKNFTTLIDQVNGYIYILCMREGNLVTYCAAESIEVTTMPDKTEYVDGDQFDPTGMIVSATTQDGSSREVSGYKWSPEVIAADTTVVTISYTEGNDTHTVEVPVTVKSKVDVLVDFTYTDNGDGTYTITDWKGTYNGEPSTEIIIPDYSWIKV